MCSDILSQKGCSGLLIALASKRSDRKLERVSLIKWKFMALFCFKNFNNKCLQAPYVNIIRVIFFYQIAITRLTILKVAGYCHCEKQHSTLCSPYLSIKRSSKEALPAFNSHTYSMQLPIANSAFLKLFLWDICSKQLNQQLNSHFRSGQHTSVQKSITRNFVENRIQFILK